MTTSVISAGTHGRSSRDSRAWVASYSACDDRQNSYTSARTASAARPSGVSTHCQWSSIVAMAATASASASSAAVISRRRRRRHRVGPRPAPAAAVPAPLRGSHRGSRAAPPSRARPRRRWGLAPPTRRRARRSPSPSRRSDPQRRLLLRQGHCAVAARGDDQHQCKQLATSPEVH